MYGGGDRTGPAAQFDHAGAFFDTLREVAHERRLRWRKRSLCIRGVPDPTDEEWLPLLQMPAAARMATGGLSARVAPHAFLYRVNPQRLNRPRAFSAVSV